MTKVDAGAGLVYPAQPDAHGYLAKADLGARWSAVDLLAELDAEGEYWVDRGNCNGTSTSPTVGMLYFLPPSAAGNGGQQADLSGGFISVADTVLKLQDGNHRN